MNPTSSTSDPSDESEGNARSSKIYRIFLSSPTDVVPERDAVERVVARINADLHDETRFRLIRWEDDYYTADSTFQEQIDSPSNCDIVICIFWKRLGSDLPDQYRRPDGSVPTGSEYEFEQAVQHAAHSPEKVPDVLVYRKEAQVLFPEVNWELEKAQRDRVLAFWQRWFRNEKGQFIAGFHSFEDTPDFEEMVEGHLRRWLKDRAGDVIWTEGSPFRGLAPFDAEHAAVFFGRRRETERARARFLANALSGVRFLLIVGPSGSGKSSLVRAGLMPRLAPAGGLGGLPHLTRRAIATPAALIVDERADWALGFSQALFVEEALGRELAQGDFNTAERLAALLARGGAEAAAPIARALERAATGAKEEEACGLILVIDQLEEIFAWPRATAETFVACLATLAADAPVYVIATMRSEFQHRLDEIPALAKLAAVRDIRGPDEPERVLDIAAPGSADIREMIAGPARAAGLTFAGAVGDRPDLQTRIERDSTPETLPAMQYLLTELYEHRDGNMLTHTAYDALGGVTGVLTSRGEAVLAKSGADGMAAFPSLVRSLVRTGPAEMPAVARRIRTDLFPPDSVAGKLIAALRDAGLVVSDRRTFRLAHESLITGWDRLGAIIANERRLFEARERVTSDYRRYLDIPESDRAARRSSLLRGLSLEEARELLAQWGPVLLSDPFPGLPDFIAASDREERRSRLRHLVVASTLSAAFAIGVLTIFWFRAESAQSARNADVRLQIARAEAALRTQFWDRALDAAIRAHNLSDTFETRSLALTALMEHSSPQLARGLPGPAAAARFDANGMLITLSRNGILTFPTARPLRNVTLAEPSGPDTAYFDFAPLPDGSLVVLMSDGRVGLLDAKSLQASADKLQPAWLSESGYFLSLSSLVDIKVTETRVRVAVADGGLKPGRLLACDLGPNRNCQATDLPPELRALAFSPDGKQLAIAGDAWVRVLNLDAPEVGPRSFENLENVAIRSLGWTAQGVLLLGTQQGELVTIAQGKDALEIGSRTNVSARPITIQRSAPSEPRVALSCDEGFVCLVNVDKTGLLQAQTRLYRIPADIVRLAWSVDGRQLVSVHADQQVRIWDRAPPHPVLDSLPSVGVPLTALAVDRQGGRVAAGDAEGHIWIWPAVGESKPPQRLDDGSDEVRQMTFSPNGTLAVVFRNGDLARIDRDAGIKKVSGNGDIQRVGWLPDGTTLAATTPTEIVLLDAGGSLSRHDIRALKPNQAIGGLLGAPGREGLIISISDGALLRWDPGSGKPAQPLLPSKESADTKSALSLAIDPSGRWLTASRADDQLRVYDLTGQAAPLTLQLPTPNSTTVAFSPDGGLLAALTSDDRLHVWRFDAQAGRAEPLVSVSAVPTVRQTKAGQGSPRQARWIDWIDNTHLGIATLSGAVLILSLESQDLTARLNALAPK